MVSLESGWSEAKPEAAAPYSLSFPDFAALSPGYARMILDP
jgi:hypothetical protein